jgi:hypothetical protein
MDPEKTGSWTGRGSDLDEIYRAQHHNSDRSWIGSQDPEKSAAYGHNLHAPSPRDESRKESVEVPDLRFSMASDDGSLDLDRPRESIGQRLAVRPHPPSRGESIRTQATGASLPELTRRETKLAQKKAHPWYVAVHKRSSCIQKTKDTDRLPSQATYRTYPRRAHGPPLRSHHPLHNLLRLVDRTPFKLGITMSLRIS